MTQPTTPAPAPAPAAKQNLAARAAAALRAFAKTRAGQQVGRFLRLFAAGLVAAVAAQVAAGHTPAVGWSALAGLVTGAAETAFRAVWPPKPAA